MARIRSVKPEFWSDEKVVELEFEYRLLFIALWNFADDQGYVDYSPKRTKMQVFPGDDVDVSRGLARLHELGLVVSYASPIGDVLHIVNWERHQRVSNPAKPRFDPSDLREYPGLPETARGVQRRTEDSRVLGKGREGKGVKPSVKASADASALDQEFEAEFWPNYPRKVSKAAALKAFKKARKTTELKGILDGLTAYVESVKGKDVTYIAHGSSWLNGRRWEDEPDVEKPWQPGDPWPESKEVPPWLA